MRCFRPLLCVIIACSSHDNNCCDYTALMTLSRTVISSCRQMSLNTRCKIGRSRLRLYCLLKEQSKHSYSYLNYLQNDVDTKLYVSTYVVIVLEYGPRTGIKNK